MENRSLRWLPVIYLIVCLPTVLFMALFRMPVGVADEWSHVARAAQLLDGRLFTEVAVPREPPRGSIDPNFRRFVEVVHRRFHERLPVTAAEYNSFRWSKDRELFAYNSAVYFPVAYILTIASIQIGRLFDLTIVETVRLSGIINGIGCLLLVSIAIAVAPRGKIALAAIGILPMTLHQFASASPDGPLIACSVLLVALLSASQGKALSLKLFGVAAGLAMVVASTKLPYLPVVVMALFVMWMVSHPRPSLAVSLAPAVAVVVIVAVGWVQITNSGTIDITWGARIGDPPRQVEFLLSNPLAVFTIAQATLSVMGVEYLHQMVGYLGWQNAPIAAWASVSFLALLAVLVTFDGLGLASAARVLMLSAILLTVGAIFAGVYVSMIAVGSLSHIIGVQGRYFLPVIPFLLCCTFELRLKATAIGVIAIVLGGLVSNVVSVAALIHRYYT